MFVDVDAITLSLSRPATYDLGAEVAAMGIVLAAASNTLVKELIFAFIAGFRDTIRLPVFLLGRDPAGGDDRRIFAVAHFGRDIPAAGKTRLFMATDRRPLRAAPGGCPSAS